MVLVVRSTWVIILVRINNTIWKVDFGSWDTEGLSNNPMLIYLADWAALGKWVYSHHSTPLIHSKAAVKIIPALPQLRSNVSSKELVPPIHIENSSSTHFKANGHFGKDTTTFLK